MIRIFYVFKLIMRGLRLRPWGSMLTFLACWFALCQLSVILYAVDMADKAGEMPATSGSMIVYLKNGINQTRIVEIERNIRSFPEISQVIFVPRKAGLEKMKLWLGPDSTMVEGVDPGILPDAYEIFLKKEYSDRVADLAGKMTRIPGIDDARYHKGLIAYIAGSYKAIAMAGSVIAGIVVVCLSLVIFLSIRVGIVTRKQEIEVLNLLGGQYLFIYSPYLIEAGAYGLLGSGAALLTTSTAVMYLHANFPALQSVLRPLGMNQALEVVFFAFVCSILGALLAIKRSIDA